MRDPDIRVALDGMLRLMHPGGDTLIRHELGICAGGRRIDVAVVNGEIAGYEIKSDEDTLGRLAGQAEAYSQVLDRAVLVTTDRHIKKAVDQLPEWWGVMVARPVDGQVHLLVERGPGLNNDQEPFALAQLLWRDEALQELRDRGLGVGLSRKARHYVWAALAEAVDGPELRALVRGRLKARREWPGGRSREPDGARSRRPATR